MKIRASLAAMGAALALGTTGALALPAVASAHSSTQTLTVRCGRHRYNTLSSSEHV